MPQKLRNYWCFQELVLPLSINAMFSGEVVKGQQSTIWKCLPGGCSLGVSAVFPAWEVCPYAFFPHHPVYSFGRGFPGGQLSGCRSHLCPLAEGEERTEI